MSYRTLNPEQKGTFVSIQGSAMSNRFNELDLNNYKNVVCCFDNDEQGKNTTKKLKKFFLMRQYKNLFQKTLMMI